jgi:hypothetical protein
MQKINQVICLIVILMLVVTNCLAENAVNPAEIDDHLHHLINKRQSVRCANRPGSCLHACRHDPGACIPHNSCCNRACGCSGGK